MIWNGWALTLIVGQAAVVAINAKAFVTAIRIVRRWNPTSLSARQLDLERRSELVASIVSCSMAFQAFSLVVFEITARSLAPFIPGAMCATGVLQAHPLGWPILFLKMGGLYLYGWWILLNYVDARVEGFPLTRLKSWSMIALFPVMLADLAAQVAFFTGLDPSVISSCCGVIFEAGATGLGASVASLPPGPMRTGLVIFVAILVAWSLLPRPRATSLRNVAYAVASVAGLILGVAAAIAFVAPYVYMAPALHCPLIFLDREHFNYGYLVYAPLFAASFLGASLGILYALGKRFPSTAPTVDRISGKFLAASGVCWGLFLITAYAPAVKFWIEAGGKADLFQGAY